MRKVLVASATVGLAIALGFGAPAFAEDTTVTVTVQASDGLTITVPGSVNLGTGSPGSAVTGQLGAVTVTDQRATLTPTWTASVVSSDFTTGGATAPETISAPNVSYWSGPATSTVGSGTFTPGQINAAAAEAIDTAQTAFAHTGGAGDNSATFNPTLIVNIPAGNVTGAYTGTVTHTVL